MNCDDDLRLGQESHALLALGCPNFEPWVKWKLQFYIFAFRGLISAALLWLFNMLCGQGQISALFSPHSALFSPHSTSAVSGLILLKFFLWVFHHRVPGSDSWGESIKAYYILNSFSRTSMFFPRQNVGLRTCPSSLTRCQRVFHVCLHHLISAPQSSSGNNCCGDSGREMMDGRKCGKQQKCEEFVRKGEWPWRLVMGLYLSHLPGLMVKLLETLNGTSWLVKFIV